MTWRETWESPTRKYPSSANTWAVDSATRIRIRTLTSWPQCWRRKLARQSSWSFRAKKILLVFTVTGRHPKDRCLDSDRRSTVVNSAALYTAFSRHQATHRETENAFAQPTATAPCCAKRELRN